MKSLTQRVQEASSKDIEVEIDNTSSVITKIKSKNIKTNKSVVIGGDEFNVGDLIELVIGVNGYGKLSIVAIIEYDYEPLVILMTDDLSFAYLKDGRYGWQFVR